MKGKTVLFTGASRGMGRLAAIELARLGAEILVVGHNDARGTEAVEALRATGSSGEFMHKLVSATQAHQRFPMHDD
jgi:NAD(P)-dependent dehydrogenase (short-subunit alcohol dehydrogenase family)